MTAKQAAIDSLRELPESASWSEIEERIRFIAAIERGRQDMAAGRTIPDTELRASLQEWLVE